jgi:hypothetical protein
MIAIKACEHPSENFSPCRNRSEAAHLPGDYLILMKRYLPPPRRTPRGGLNKRENFQDRKPVQVFSGEERQMVFTQMYSAIDTTDGQVLRRYHNPGMPTRRGQSPQERQIRIKKRTQGLDFKRERVEIEGAHS